MKTTDYNSKTVQEASKRDDRAESSARSRDRGHVDYWKQRLFRNSYTREGKTFELKSWSVKIQTNGRRETFTLNNTSREAAAKEAKEIYIFAKANGMAAALTKFKRPTAKRVESPSLGEFLSEVEAKSDLKAKTFKQYAGCLRRIAADVFGIQGGTSKYDYKKGGNTQWVTAVESIKLADLTPEKIQIWKLDYVRAAGVDPTRITEARRGVNSFIRGAKSLFSERNTRFLSVTLPNPLPFEGVEFEKQGSMRYKSQINLRVLIADAKRELGQAVPDDIEGDQIERCSMCRRSNTDCTCEVYKIFLLALGAGLRKAEIDTLTWQQINWEEGSIWIGRTKYFSPKTRDSEGVVAVDSSLLHELRKYVSYSQEEFVINSPLPARPGVDYQYYRADVAFNRLGTWLKRKGVTDRKPLHALRKEFGSQICQEGGIYAASTALRHSSIGTTAAHYLDKRQKVTFRLGSFLSQPQLSGTHLSKG